MAVVGSHAADDDRAPQSTSGDAVEKGGAAGAELVDQHFDVGDAAVIIDGYRDAYPADLSDPGVPVRVNARANGAM